MCIKEIATPRMMRERFRWVVGSVAGSVIALSSEKKKTPAATMAAGDNT
jgi:hypothetical protein